MCHTGYVLHYAKSARHKNYFYAVNVTLYKLKYNGGEERRQLCIAG